MSISEHTSEIYLYIYRNPKNNVSARLDTIKEFKIYPDGGFYTFNFYLKNSEEDNSSLKFIQIEEYLNLKKIFNLLLNSVPPLANKKNHIIFIKIKSIYNRRKNVL